jgi:hypothetical protein
MSEIEDGGQAFPRAGYDGPDMNAPAVDGMSLRDYFAAKAMQALITKYGNEDGGSCAAYSYAMADAMLQAREAK